MKRWQEIFLLHIWQLNIKPERYKRFLFSLAAQVGPVQIFFSSPCTGSTLLSPSPSKLGRQPCWVACPLLCVSGPNFWYLSSEVSETSPARCWSDILLPPPPYCTEHPSISLKKFKSEMSIFLIYITLHCWPVLRIRDILVRIRIRGSVPLTNGSRSSYFRQWRQQNFFFSNFFCFSLLEGAFSSFF